MEKIYVDDAMKQRILRNIEQEPKEQRITQNIEQKPKEQRIPQNIEQKPKEQRIPQNIEQKPKEQRIPQNMEQEPKEQRIPQNIEQEPKEQRILQNIEQEQNKYFTDKNGKKHIFHYFHYKKISVSVAAILIIFCFTSYFGMSAILHTNGVNQHNVASDNKKDSTLENADAKDTDSKSANANTKNIDSESANTRDTDSNQLNSDTIDTEDEANTAAESDTETAHGINQYSSAKELSQKVGFTISDIPSSLIPFKISEKIYADCGDGLAEIQYYNDKADNVIYHKQTAANADVSGDYTEYSKITTIRVRSTNICLKGENNKYNLATWSKGNYSYSLYFSEAITEKAFQNILKITI